MTLHIHLVGKPEGLHRKGLLKEGIIEKELAKNTTGTTALSLVDCTQSSSCTPPLLSGLQLALIKPLRIQEDFRQEDFTNFCENIYFLQDCYNPIAHGCCEVCLCVAIGALGETSSTALLVVTMWTVVVNRANTSGSST